MRRKRREKIKVQKKEVKLRNRVKAASQCLEEREREFKSMQGLMYSMPALFTEHVAGLMITRLLAMIE